MAPAAKPEPVVAKPEVVAADEPVLITKAEPAPEPAPEPMAAAFVAPAAKPAIEAERRVFVLDDDEPSMHEAREVAQAQMEDFKTEVDTMVDEIHLVEPEKQAEPAAILSAPKVDPMQFAPKTEVIASAFRNDNDVTTAAERIRRIHDLLRNNPDGADIVQHMTTEQISEDELYAGAHSSMREATGSAMRADGSIAKNPFLYGNQPD